ncbi:MAG: ribulose-phosphate 3-epimerase [Pirellulaceae bacterium]|jgi:ribulose-phosphate 3-epimerase|nr:ribulose-phosphate 3-epimerase [Planctomycetaceae bacterium]HIM30533.1 ribulose-phosphate 3-epimerase [Planctomycetota bacterium]
MTPRSSNWCDGTPVILPSFLLCDFGNLEREVRALEAAGVRGLHLDVMDGQFVPNLTYGMPIVKGLRRLTDLPIDVHLMISSPAQYIDAFIDSGADWITFHREAVDDPRPILEQIRSRGVGAGIAINPQTPVEEIEPCLSLCDMVLVMSVQAGFGGQSFDDVALEKLERLVTLASDETLLEVDGGVNASTIQRCSQAGATLFVVGSAIFGQPDYAAAIDQLSRLAAESETV